MKRIAIYSRKSKFTGVGDSIENQVQLCREYSSMHFNSTDENITIFEDEGFSGSTTNRPQFQLFVEEAKRKKFDVLICYRLDRISRNIADFATLIEDLQQYGVAFVSIKEQFDTSTPMGRAMMYIASVFAQLERETIAERIRDNMMQLAKTGRWLGGITPTGYESKEVLTIDNEGNNRKSMKLEIIEDEAKQVKLIFDKFIELKSLYQVELYCFEHNIKSKNGNYYYTNTISTIIENPVYAIGDKKICDFLKDEGHKVYVDERDFDGKRGLMVYNKTTQSPKKKTIVNDEWTVSLGVHKGIVSSSDWIKASELRDMRRCIKTRKRIINANALLSGILICESCGSFMRKAGTRQNKNGTIAYYYMCELKDRSRSLECNSKNIRGDKLDQLVLERLKKVSLEESEMNNHLGKSKLEIDNEINKIEDKIKRINNSITKNDSAINNLLNVLSEGEESLATKHIINQMNSLEKDNIELKEKLLRLNQNKNAKGIDNDGVNLFRDMLVKFKDVIDDTSPDEQMKLIRMIVDKIIWDGKDIDIIFFGVDE